MKQRAISHLNKIIILVYTTKGYEARQAGKIVDYTEEYITFVANEGDPAGQNINYSRIKEIVEC